MTCVDTQNRSLPAPYPLSRLKKCAVATYADHTIHTPRKFIHYKDIPYLYSNFRQVRSKILFEIYFEALCRKIGKKMTQPIKMTLLITIPEYGKLLHNN